MIKTCVAIEHGLAALVPLLRQRNSEYRTPRRRAFAQRTTAATRSFDIAGGQIHA